MTLHPNPKESSGGEAFRMKAKRAGHCAECEETLFEGDWVIYDPVEFKVYCEMCGEEYLP